MRGLFILQLFSVQFLVVIQKFVHFVGTLSVGGRLVSKPFVIS